MSEAETRLREVFAEVAPAAPQTEGLVRGAQAQAVRMRRRRAATVASALLLVVALAGGLVAILGFRDRAPVPADRIEHLTCELASRDLPTQPALGARPPSTITREVLACPDSSPSSPVVLILPSEPVTQAADLDYVRFEAPSSAISCPDLPAGHTYRMLFLGLDGQARVLDNTALACNGWSALDRYTVALGDQQSTQDSTRASDPFPQCPSILGQHLNRTSTQAPALARGTRIVAASSCLHPLSYPGTVPVVHTVDRRPLTAADLAVLNTALAQAGSVKKRAESCPGPRAGAEGVVRAVTSTGTHIVLAHVCANSFRMVVNWNEDDVVTFTQKTFDALGGS
jgi:hypothetical protein